MGLNEAQGIEVVGDGIVGGVFEVCRGDVLAEDKAEKEEIRHGGIL